MLSIISFVTGLTAGILGLVLMRKQKDPAQAKVMRNFSIAGFTMAGIMVLMTFL